MLFEGLCCSSDCSLPMPLPSSFWPISLLMAASLSIAFTLPNIAVAQLDAGNTTLAYTYKARNLNPDDFGIEGRSWEAVLRKMNARFDEKPDDIGLLFQRAIAYREYGARRSLVLRRRDWKRSRLDFEALIERDSTFEDVLYQFAVLQRYDGHFDRALNLLNRQLALRSDQPHVYAALFRLYRQFIFERDQAEVASMFEGDSSSHAMFVRAELERKAGRLREADGMLSDLLQSLSGLPPQIVLLTRARLYYAMGMGNIAEAFVHQAISIIRNPSQARIVLEDFKYILNDEEINRYLTLEAPEEFQAFFSGVIERRNPARSEAVDRRLAEHYRRLLQAETQYAFYESREAYRVGDNARADKMADNDFPMAYWLNGEFGDKGLIFIRHGRPADIVGSVSEGTPFIESWRYLGPKMDFHFEGHANLASLIPTLPLDSDVLEARELWGGIYTRLASTVRLRDRGDKSAQDARVQMEFLNYGSELLDESIGYVQDGLTSDRHQWPDQMQHLPIPYFLAAFQGEDEQTDVEVYFSVPIGLVSNVLKDREQLEIEVGLSVHDMNWQEVYGSLETLKVSASRAKDAVAVDFVRFAALPDSYHVNLHIKIKDTEWLGSYQFDYSVPDYTSRPASSSLLISDLVPAFEVTPIDRPSRYAKKGLYLRTNPGRGYRREDPFFIYYEIYNLTYANTDLTHFDVTYTLQKENTGRRKGLFRRRASEPLISITYAMEGDAANVAEYGEIDMSAVPAGTYELIVTITDKNTGESTSNVRVIQLG